MRESTAPTPCLSLAFELGSTDVEAGIQRGAGTASEQQHYRSARWEQRHWHPPPANRRPVGCSLGAPQSAIKSDRQQDPDRNGQGHSGSAATHVLSPVVDTFEVFSPAIACRW